MDFAVAATTRSGPRYRSDSCSVYSSDPFRPSLVSPPIRIRRVGRPRRERGRHHRGSRRKHEENCMTIRRGKDTGERTGMSPAVVLRRGGSRRIATTGQREREREAKEGVRGTKNARDARALVFLSLQQLVVSCSRCSRHVLVPLDGSAAPHSRTSQRKNLALIDRAPGERGGGASGVSESREKEGRERQES